MKMDVEDLEVGIALITLDGDLDAKGTGEIEARFAAVTGCADKVVVDLADVGFLASIGIRTLLSASKILSRRGGRLILLRPNPSVVMVLKTCGVDTIIPIAETLSDAERAIL